MKAAQEVTSSGLKGSRKTCGKWPEFGGGGCCVPTVNLRMQLNNSVRSQQKVSHQECFRKSKAEPFPFLPEWMAAMVVREPWAEVTEP